jgi:hypothetical protein
METTQPAPVSAPAVAPVSAPAVAPVSAPAVAPVSAPAVARNIKRPYQRMPQTPMIIMLRWFIWLATRTIVLIILFYLIGVAVGRRKSSYSCASGTVEKTTPYHKAIFFQ